MEGRTDNGGRKDGGEGRTMVKGGKEQGKEKRKEDDEGMVMAKEGR